MLTDSLALCAIAGFCAKVVDEFSDMKIMTMMRGKFEGMRKAALPAIPIILAVIYGASLGWLSATTLLSSLFIALAIASLLAGKIDHEYHMLGAAVFAAVLLVMSITVLDPWLFSLFLVTGLMDELEMGGVTRGVGGLLNRERLWTPLAAMTVFVFYSAPLIYLLALIAFDAAYRFGGWLVGYETASRMAPARASAKLPARKRR